MNFSLPKFKYILNTFFCTHHDLRHTYVTLRISKGDNVADVSKQLGHHSVKFTMDIYYHWIPGGNKKEVDRLDDIDSNATTRKLSAIT